MEDPSLCGSVLFHQKMVQCDGSVRRSECERDEKQTSLTDCDGALHENQCKAEQQHTDEEPSATDEIGNFQCTPHRLRFNEPQESRYMASACLIKWEHKMVILDKWMRHAAEPPNHHTDMDHMAIRSVAITQGGK
jgi:hypothetical protein